MLLTWAEKAVGVHAMRRHLAKLAMVLMLFLGADHACAQDWQWPPQMVVAGFIVTGIQGVVYDDGSGTAVGLLQIAGIQGQRASLVRSARGDISCSAALEARLPAGEVRGDFSLTQAGLRGRGVVQGQQRQILDAVVSVEPNGRFTGSGRLILGRIGIDVRFSMSGSLFEFAGSSAAQAQTDTPLAVYRFDGLLSIEGSAARISITAGGQVRRTGKLADQVTSYPVSGVSVNPSDGLGTVEVGGVSVTFKFF